MAAATAARQISRATAENARIANGTPDALGFVQKSAN
jgi:hypothetical protein